MNIRSQTLILVILILASLSLTNIPAGGRLTSQESIPEKGTVVSAALPQKRAAEDLDFEKKPLFQANATIPKTYEVKKAPERNWEVLDPQISSEAVLIQTLDGSYPFFHLNTYKVWPIASLTKLFTALVVLEDIGLNKKIPIDEKAVATEGEAGGFRSGEVFTARDLVKIMLLTSSNDAAAAFENYVGRDEMVRLLNQKARELNLNQTILYDAAGISDLNEGTATDLLRLTRYLLTNEPEILNWTRTLREIVQPINEPVSRTVSNINPLVSEPGFLGGKTGTSEKAKENLIALFSLNNERIIMIIMGSRDRYGEAKSLLEWLGRAYIFP